MNYVVLSDLSNNLSSAMSGTSLWTNIVQTILFIGLGFFFTKKKLLPDNTGKVLTKFVMSVTLPCLAFCSFMSDFTVQGGIDAIVNFILGFVFYVGFIFLGKLVFLPMKDKKKAKVLSVLFAFGSTTFFGYPLVSSIFGSTAANNFNIMNVAYRVFLYSYAYLAICTTDKEEENVEIDKENKPKVEMKDLMKKVFLNPIVIATFAGLFLWLLQAIEGAKVVPADWLKEGVSETKYVPWRFDITLPWIFTPLKVLGNLASPLILFAIGCTLGGTSISESAKDKYAWIYAGIKVFALPSVVLVFLILLRLIGNAGNFPQLVSFDTLASSVITWMVPPATVAVGYCISADNEKEMAAHTSLISTLVAIVGIIFWVLILTVIQASGFFAIN